MNINTLLTCTALLLFLLAMAILGRKMRCRLPDDHLAADSAEAVKLSMGLLASMTGLLLGLLVSSAKSNYDALRTEVIQMSAKVSILGRVLDAYGPEASAARGDFSNYATETLHLMWPQESGVHAQLGVNGEKGELLYLSLCRLAARDSVRNDLKERAKNLAVELGELRMLIKAQAGPSVPPGLLLVLGCWLGVLFFSFSLLAPPNPTTASALAAAAFSIVGAVFLIQELDQPFSGSLPISSQPMLQALEMIKR
jgi:hypothetical protein